MKKTSTSKFYLGLFLVVMLSCKNKKNKDNFIPNDIVQSVTQIDSLFLKAKTNKDSSLFYLNEAKNVYETNKVLPVKATYLINLGKNYLYAGNFDSAKAIAQKGILLDYSEKELNYKGKFYNLNGNIEGYQKKIYSSIENYLKAEQLFLLTLDSNSIGGVYNNIANNFFSLKDYTSANLYAKKGYDFLPGVNDISFKANIMTTYALSLVKINKPFEALKIERKAEIVVDSSNNVIGKMAIFIGYAEIYKTLKNFDSAMYYYYNCISLSKKTGIAHFELMSQIGILSIDEERKNYLKIINKSKQIFELAKLTNNNDVLHTTKRIVGRAYANQNNFTKGYFYLNESYNLYDSVAGIENQKNINELLIKYEDVQKRNKILNQQLEIKKQKTISSQRLNFILLLLIGLITILFLFYYKQKLNNEKQKRKELELKNDINNAFLVGEEKERKRISFEIHDGIAGMISAIIMKVKNNQDAIPHLNKLHDDSRRIAYNLRPIEFEKYNFNFVVEQLCQKLSTDEIDISFHSNNLEINFDPQKNQILYRLIQEMINNAIKHAACKTIFVNLIKENNCLEIIIEDDGKGIQEIEIELGLTSIKERVESLQAKLQIEKLPVQGTKIKIYDIKF
ncbi:MAG: hypothetical protein KA275_01625 [Chitinophagaceae bacterium]|nr:hypothetical protein [Chitinophagaceae bacterium]